jgi:hypothetical protein
MEDEAASILASSVVGFIVVPDVTEDRTCFLSLESRMDISN